MAECLRHSAIEVETGSTESIRLWGSRRVRHPHDPRTSWSVPDWAL